ncbi:Undecaprenyl-phosphate mannosyltransferase [Bremerella volcania]|uniref:Undecaprenyl-phosphate mannosyltransferase n=1 Tax=Bremerella volcania TaxID=2527984 RepID=A0A518CDE5_9BACT|nr:polyprenol monophosphomannose synthase [Bremerella volcania]QDU77243.1 Undecaprenyl-phosphate mannosyltransferase [Bremerella volcania]
MSKIADKTEATTHSDLAKGKEHCVKTGRVLVAIATYNEIENLPNLVERLVDTLPEADLLVIDDGSPDGTGQWCEEHAKMNARMHCLHRKGKPGLGSAIIAAMQYAIDNNYDVMINLDADLSHPPEKIPDLLEAWQAGPSESTVVIGSRYVPGGGISGWPMKRHFMSRGINVYTRWLLWLPMADCSGSFRAYPVHLLRKIDFDSFLSYGYSFFEEVLYHLKEQGATFVEVPFQFVERQHGSSKINMRKAMVAVWTIFRLGLNAWRPF